MLVTIQPVDYSEAFLVYSKHNQEVFGQDGQIDFPPTLPEPPGPKMERFGFLIKEGQDVIGWHFSRQSSKTSIFMQNSGILPPFQGKGYYKLLLDHVSEFFQKLGYCELFSYHLGGNVRVIIPKLKNGFVITGCNLHVSVGFVVTLTKFLEAKRKMAFDVRSGAVAVTQDFLNLTKVIPGC